MVFEVNDMNENEYIDTDIAFTKAILNQKYGIKATQITDLKPLIHSVIAEIYCNMVKARRFKDMYKDTSEYKFAQSKRHECYGMIKALLTLELISRYKYILLCKSIDTYDLSIIEEYMYKLSK